MKRRRTLGVAYTNEGLKSTLEASVEKLVSRLEKRGSSSNSWATYSVENKDPRQRVKSGDLTSRPEDPINPGGKAILTVSGTFRQGKKTKE